MPGLDGAEVLSAVRAEGFAVPVVMISAHMDDALAARLLALGANRCLWKLKLGGELAPTVAALLA
ncbi:MAG TPA: response regulator, partial [Myxococcales bacterium]|nr:response regulator [Myxococcales bacterium]